MKISDRCGGQCPPYEKYEKPPKSFRLFAFSPFPPKVTAPARGMTGNDSRPQEQLVDRHQVLSTGAALQDYLLDARRPRGPGAHPPPAAGAPGPAPAAPRRPGAGRPAWEPLALFTLNAWWSELFQGLWPQEALAPALVRLALWRQALAAAPPPSGPTPELAWAQALDEAHTLLCRYSMAGGGRCHRGRMIRRS